MNNWRDTRAVKFGPRINLYVLCEAIKMGHPVSDEQLRDAFHRLVAIWTRHEEDADEQILRTLPIRIRRRILRKDTSKKK